MNSDPYDGGHVTRWLLETDSLEGFLQTLADAAMGLSGVQSTGVTVERDGRPLTVVSAGPSARELDEKQYGRDDGPCLTALRSGTEIMVDDMLAESRWGDYPAYAAACGIRSSFSLPIAPYTDSPGALNLYAVEPERFKEQDTGILRVLASQATGGIAVAQRIADAQDFADQLQTAMRSRGVIDQALGVIMGQNRCTAEEAFGILRSASQHRNIKLRDLCTELITNLTGKPPADSELRPPS